jgi:hypothetical protein
MEEYNTGNMEIFPKLSEADKRRLVLAAVFVGALGVVVLALPVVIPLLGFLTALGVIAAAIYGVYKYISGK